MDAIRSDHHLRLGPGGVRSDPVSRPEPDQTAGIERYYTVKEAADVLRCSAKTLGNDLTARKLDHLRPTKVRRKWLIPESALRELLERGRREALGIVPPLGRHPMMPSASRDRARMTFHPSGAESITPPLKRKR